ncbi:farnesyl pyrophosphate synthase [Anabrus simplex]|uniref:farnesyl pyrophosphate synthase n=1 Tax=Anabrus simplex TaxID=316456 RepID=UPI0035A33F1D
MLMSVRSGVFCTFQVASRRLSGTSSFLQSDQFALSSQHTADSSKSAVSSKRPWSMSARNTTTAVPLAYSGTAVNKDERREFMAVFPDIVRDLTDAGRHLDVPDATKWFAKVLQYNVPGGKKNRGLAVVFAYRMLTPPQQLTPENIRLAQILGWCVEILQAFFLVMDDVMDNALTRRGRPCWYRHNNIGTAAVNDGILLESGLYQLTRKYFSDKSYYTQILELFHDVTLKTSMGQSLDLLSTEFGKKPNFSKFTMDHYSAIVKYKAAYSSFQLPVALAMLMAGVKDEEMHRQAKTILLEMGHFFQVQDDFLDCFGDPAVTGKIGTDIQEGKCTWLAVVALQRMTPEQRALFEDSYGSSDPAKIETVKELYEVLCIPSMFSVYEEETYNLISTHIQQISRGMPHQLFFKLLDKISRRVC